MTTKISAIIAQYIKEETRLIIPEVGTLIRRKESGEIVFMEMLRKNDGVLTGLVVNILDVSPSKAADIVARYSQAIKHQLQTSKKFVLDGVGVLLARPDGSVDFSFNPFAQTLPGTEESLEEFTPAEPRAEEVKASEPKPAAEPVVTPKPAVEPAPAVTPAPAVEVEENVEVLESEEPEEPKSAPREAVIPTPRPEPQVAKPEPKVEPKVEPKPAAKAEGTAPAPKPAPKPEPKVEPAKPLFNTAVSDDDEEEERPRAPRLRARHSIKKIDPITIVALIAVALAIIVVIWGVMPSGDRLEVQVEAPVEVVE